MEEARAIKKIKKNLSKEKIEFINAAYTEEVKLALKKRMKLTNHALSRVFLTRKDVGKDCAENINELIFYLKSNYSNHNREQARVDNIPQDGSYISFKVSNRLKNLF